MHQILAAAEQHKRGLAATDPITGALIGPLCISRLPLNDPKRKPMLALAHFSVGDLRRFNVSLSSSSDRFRFSCTCNMETTSEMSLFYDSLLPRYAAHIWIVTLYRALAGRRS